MKLIYSNREGEFVDKSGKLICFDPSVYHDCKSFLLIKKDNLLKYMRENNLQIIWTVLGEKNIIGGWLARKTEFVGRQEINGVYYMGGDIITGECKIKITL